MTKVYFGVQKSEDVHNENEKSTVTKGTNYMRTFSLSKLLWLVTGSALLCGLFVSSNFDYGDFWVLTLLFFLVYIASHAE